MTEIKIVKNFLDDTSLKKFMLYNDWLIKNKIDKFYFHPADKNKTRPTLQFGWDEGYILESHRSFSAVLNEEQSSDAIDLSKMVIATIKKEFEDSSSLYLNSFWFGKQSPGSSIGAHADCGPDENWQFEYSAILYLNDFDGGELEFINLKKIIKPEAGDLVLFKSKEAGVHRVSNINSIRYTIPMWFTYDEQFALKG